MIIHFGKYKGCDVSEVPSSYLCYVLEEYTVNPYLKEEIKDELSSRFAPTISYHPTDTIKEHTIKEAYRQLSKVYHPDLGGSHEAMQAINKFYEMIKG